MKTVSATKGLDVDGARVTIKPTYDVESEDTDVTVTYNKDGTDVEINANLDAQSLTISRQIDDENRVAPTLTSAGGISVEWERDLGDDNSLTTTLKPDDSVNLEWKDSAWTANINIPLDGTDITGTDVSIKREVSF